MVNGKSCAGGCARFAVISGRCLVAANCALSKPSKTRFATSLRCRSSFAQILQFCASNVPLHRTPRTGRAAFPLSVRGRQRSVASHSASRRGLIPVVGSRPATFCCIMLRGRALPPSICRADGIGFLRRIRMPRAVIIAEKQPRTDRSAAACFLRRQLSCLTSFSFLSAFPQVSVSLREE